MGLAVNAEALTAPTASYGDWERADDVAPVLYVSGLTGQPLLRHAQRRRVYTYWRVGGERKGRWEWEYR